MSSTETSSLRLFFALWPPANLLPAISEAATALHSIVGGRIIPAENFHVTLLFLGDVEASMQQKLIQQINSLTVNPFKLDFCRRDIWKNGIGSLVCRSIPDELIQLNFQLKQIARRLDIAVEERSYIPHISLLRKAKLTAKLDDDSKAQTGCDSALSWEATEFCLVSSTQKSSANAADKSHSTYQILQRWPLEQKN